MAAIRKKSPENLGKSGQNLIRILIASYFLGVSLGVIGGTDASPLVATFLPPEVAGLVGKSVIFVLAYFVMTGLWLRPAALLLGLVTFWASYIANFSTPGPISVGDFWRDLTLIGALMLTYVQSPPRAVRQRMMIRRKARARRVVPAKPVTPRRVSVTGPVRATRQAQVVALNPAARVHSDTIAEAASPENIFLDDAAAS